MSLQSDWDFKGISTLREEDASSLILAPRFSLQKDILTDWGIKKSLLGSLLKQIWPEQINLMVALKLLVSFSDS